MYILLLPLLSLAHTKAESPPFSQSDIIDSIRLSRLGVILPFNTNEPFVANSYVLLRCETTTTNKKQPPPPNNKKGEGGGGVGGREAPYQTVCALFQGGAWPLNE